MVRICRGEHASQFLLVYSSFVHLCLRFTKHYELFTGSLKAFLFIHDYQAIFNELIANISLTRTMFDEFVLVSITFSRPTYERPTTNSKLSTIRRRQRFTDQIFYCLQYRQIVLNIWNYRYTKKSILSLAIFCEYSITCKNYVSLGMD